jgi:glycosyltransferase involved in cell wall biosynthesis
MTPKKIQVLLATLNGENFLKELLESLANQRSVDVHLIVSDDGSADRTLEIINSYAEVFSSVEIHSGPRRGHSANFDYLMTLRRPGIPVAFADQDDIWEPNKLMVLSQSLPKNEPALIFSKVQVLGTNSIYPSSLKAARYSHLFQNKAMGCTQLLTPELCSILDNLQRPISVDFDWWNYIVASELGVPKTIDYPLVKYRLHENNTVGIPSKLTRIKRILCGYLRHRSVLSPQFLGIIDAQGKLSRMISISSGFDGYLKDLNFEKLVRAIREKHFRDSFVENLYVCGLLIVYRMKIRNE